MATTKYIARVYVVVEADSEYEATDAISAAMSENLQSSGAIVEWHYANTDGVYDFPLLVAAADNPDNPDDWANADLADVHDRARQGKEPIRTPPPRMRSSEMCLIEAAKQSLKDAQDYIRALENLRTDREVNDVLDEAGIDLPDLLGNPELTPDRVSTRIHRKPTVWNVARDHVVNPHFIADRHMTVNKLYLSPKHVGYAGHMWITSHEGMMFGTVIHGDISYVPVKPLEDIPLSMPVSLRAAIQHGREHNTGWLCLDPTAAIDDAAVDRGDLYLYDD